MAGYHSCMNRGRGSSYNKLPREMWEIEIKHDGLNKYRHIRGSDKYIVEQKAACQLAKWNEIWDRMQDAQKKRTVKALEKADKELNKIRAEIDTANAKAKISELQNILHHTLSINDAIDWGELLISASYKSKKPEEPVNKKQPILKKHPKYSVPNKPEISDGRYQIRLWILDKIFQSRKIKKESQMIDKYNKDMALWEQDVALKKREWDVDCLSIDRENNIKIAEWNKQNSALIEKYKRNLEEWEKKRDDFKKNVNEKNEKVKEKKKLYESGDEGAVIDYCDMVLANSEYPEYFPQDWVIEFNSNEKIMVIDYDLIDVSSIPNIKETKYIPSTNGFSEKLLSKKDVNDIYDNVVYQVAIRTIHEIFESDVINAIDSVVFNGRLKTTDKATGRDVNYCIISVQAEKDEFMAINLEKIDPKECFKLLKGVSGTKLHLVTPVPPIISIDYKDDRVVDHYDVTNKLDNSVNLAAMDWYDFENLVREIFEKEFIGNGGVVKITQSSRDGGVDAIAFDPDPIRGGKIVIQAKRYTNVVGVSAVRDLYGTTLNEGATKGILVTTSNYGPDAYSFAKNKPITLLNGSNLLHLLEKHGHKAKIDIKEAKKILNNG